MGLYLVENPSRTYLNFDENFTSNLQTQQTSTKLGMYTLLIIYLTFTLFFIYESQLVISSMIKFHLKKRKSGMLTAQQSMLKKISNCLFFYSTY